MSDTAAVDAQPLPAAELARLDARFPARSVPLQGIAAEIMKQ